MMMIVMTTTLSVYSAYEGTSAGARSEGLGGAYTGLSDTSEGIFSNVGGIAGITRGEVTGNFGRMYMGLSDGSNLGASNIAAVYPIGVSRKGGFARWGVAGVGIKMFSLDSYYSESAIGVYYGRYVSTKVSIGGGLKYLRTSYGNDAYRGMNGVFSGGTTAKSNVSMDIGMLVKVDNRIQVGASIGDINSPDMGIKYEDPVSRKVRIGGVYRHKTLNVAFDIDREENDMTFITGIEKWYMSNQVAVRGGIGVGSRKYEQVSVGGGYEGDNVVVDYSFVYPLSGIRGTYGTHSMSVGYRFGRSEKENIKEAARLYKQSKDEAAAGEYESAKKLGDQASDLDSVNREYEEFTRKVGVVSRNIKGSKGEGKVEEAVRRGVGKWLLEGDAKRGVNILLYGYSLDTKRGEIEKLMREIAREGNVEVEELTKGWTLTEQKTYQALENFKQKKYYECIKLCEETLYLEPGNVTAYKRLGSAYYMLRKFDQAKEYWSKVVELAPNDKEVIEIKGFLKEIERQKKK
jgi:hypothetical protein